MYPDGTPYSIFYDLVNGHPVFYPMVVVLLFLVYITAVYLVHFFIQKKRTVPTSEVAAQKEKQEEKTYQYQ